MATRDVSGSRVAKRTRVVGDPRDSILELVTSTESIEQLPPCVVANNATIPSTCDTIILSNDENVDPSRPDRFHRYSTYDPYNRQFSTKSTTITVCAVRGTPQQFLAGELCGTQFSSSSDGLDNAFTISLCGPYSVLYGLTLRNDNYSSPKSEPITVLPPMVPVSFQGAPDNGCCHLFRITKADSTFYPDNSDAYLYLFIGLNATIFETCEPVTYFESSGHNNTDLIARVHVGINTHIIFNDDYGTIDRHGMRMSSIGDFEVQFDDDVPSQETDGSPHGFSRDGCPGRNRVVSPGLVAAHWRSVCNSGYLVNVST